MLPSCHVFLRCRAVSKSMNMLRVIPSLLLRTDSMLLPAEANQWSPRHGSTITNPHIIMIDRHGTSGRGGAKTVRCAPSPLLSESLTLAHTLSTASNFLFPRCQIHYPHSHPDVYYCDCLLVLLLAVLLVCVLL